MPKATQLPVLIFKNKRRPVQAYQLAPGLYAHKHLARRNTWTLAHHSGYRIGNCCGATLREVRNTVALTNRDTPFDWSCDFEDICNSVDASRKARAWHDLYMHYLGRNA